MTAGRRRKPGDRWCGAHASAADSCPPDPVRLFIDTLTLRVLAIAMAGVMALSPAIVFAQSAPPGVTQIVPDGRTATSVTTSGSITNVTTNTVSGPNAFNSFSHFRVGSGNTANLQLPNGTSNLINLVRDSPVVVDGILNAYKNGQIGGNVYFADPHGFVVGKGGVVNVGTLNVTTPSKEFMDGVISPTGQINHGSVQQLMSGNVPLSPNGFISIKGRVNAIEGARLVGQNVYIGGGRRDAAHLDHASKFASTVNSTGLRSGAGIVVRNGSIQIVAAETAKVNGRLSTAGRGGRNGGDVTVTAKNITVGKNANIWSNARGNTGAGNAGNITLLANDTLRVTSGAFFNASSRRGNAGTVELSSKNKVELASAIYDLSAPNGKAGKLFIDPLDLVINAGSSMFTNGGEIHLQADNSITVASDGTLDSRNRVNNVTVGSSGDITLEAPHISVAGKILADIDANSAAGITAGDVTLIARSNKQISMGPATASAIIDVDGTITGANIALSTDATAKSSYTNGLDLFVATIAIAVLSGVNAGYVAGSATSKININSGANVQGSGAVSFDAKGAVEASTPAITFASGALNPAAATAVVGMVDADVASRINAGATVKAGNGLSVTASNDATLDVSAIGISRNGVKVNVTAAYSEADIKTRAEISSGASLTVAGNLDVIARNKNSFSTVSTATALGGAVAGIAFGYSTLSSDATALLGASAGTQAVPVGNVRVEATSFNQKTALSTSVTVGNPALLGLLLDVIGDSATGGAVANAIFNTGPGQSGSSAVPKFGSTVSIINSDMSATAAIAKDATVNAAAPTVRSSGNVSVYSDVNVTGVRSLADTSVNSENAIPTSSNPAATVGIAAAVALGNFTQESSAYIGPNTTVRAQNVAVSANIELPITNTWTQWAGFSEVMSHLNGNLGVVNNILTSYANAVSASQDLSLAGAFNYVDLQSTATAWVASGATVEQSGAAAGTGTWAMTLKDGSTRSFSNGISVLASTELATINVDGNSSPIFPLGSTSQGSAVGGSLGVFASETRTTAGIADGATVKTGDKLAVNAATHDTVVGVAPSSGKAAGTLGLTGVGTVSLIDNTTHASISNKAIVEAPTIDVSATQAVSIVSASAAFSVGREAAVGISLSLLIVEADTAAYIGDNRSDIVNANLAIDPVASSASTGHAYATNLNVAATASGRLYSVSAAAAVTDPTPAPPKSAREKIKAIAFAVGQATGWINFENAADQGNDSAANGAGGTPSPAFNLDIAGSTSASSIGFNTRASIDHAVVSSYAANTGVTTTVIALNNTITANASGAAALSLASLVSPGSASVSGAIALGLSENRTQAYIADSSISDANDVSVSALAGGQHTVVGLGLAASASSLSASISLSASVAIVTDSVQAHIDNTTMSGRTGGSGRDIDVNAYQTTNIGVGGGSIYAGGKGGIGLAITYAEIADPSGVDAVNARIRNSSVDHFATVDVLAVNSSRIGAGAAVVGGGVTVGMSGAFAVSHITPTTSASIDAEGQAAGVQPVIDVTGDVNVRADGGRVATFDSKLDNVVTQTNNGNAVTNDSGIDFSGLALNNNTTVSPGAAIFGVAGIVQSASGNVGFSLAQNTIAQTHSAVIRHVKITTSGDVTVAANDNSTMLGIGIGVSASGGLFGGMASTVVNLIDNTVMAQIGGDAGADQITARTITVEAVNGSDIRGTAGTLGFSSGAAAAGLSTAYDSIGGSVVADVDGATLSTSQDVMVRAASTGSILTVALGIAASASVGVAGSVATNVVSTDVTADIKGGADVIAAGNVGVIAGNSNAMKVVAGAAGASLAGTGVGVSVVANAIVGTTEAYIDGASTKVDARGQGSAFFVNGGTLANGGFNLSSADDPSLALPDLSETQRATKGLAVVATSHQAIVAEAITLGLTAGLFQTSAAVTAVTSVIAGETKAYVNQASLDTRLTTAAAAGLPEVYLGASSHSYARTLVIAGSASTGFNGAGAGNATVQSRETYAYMTGATVGGTVAGSQTVGKVTVNAQSTQIASDVAVGFSVSLLGGAATALVTSFAADTEAYIEGGAIHANGLAVTAKSTNGYFAAAGAGAAGFIAGVAGAFVVGVSQNKTLAYIGAAGTSTTTTIDLGTGSGLTVSAISDNTLNSYAVGGAGAGAVAVAGMADFTVVSNRTEARLEKVAGTQNSGVSVSATETVSIDANAGAGALSIVTTGVGAGVNVVLLKSRVTATVVNSAIDTEGAFNVAATGNKSVEMTTSTVGAGGTNGIGAAVNVLLIGSTVPTGAQGQIASTVTAADGSQGPHGDGIDRANTPGANQTPAAAPAPVSVANSLGSADSRVVAEINGGTTKAASTAVSATSNVGTTNLAVGAGLGVGATGVGAAVAYSRLNETVFGSVTSGVTSGSVAVSATLQDLSGHAIDVEAGAGAGSLGTALGAAVADGATTSAVTAQVANLTGSNSGNVTVSARDGSSIDSHAVGAAVAGGTALGASAAVAAKNTGVLADVLPSTTITNYNALSVTAAESGSVAARADAGAGGITLAGVGAGATATDTGTVTARIRDHSTLTIGSGGMLVGADATPEVSAYALGVAVSAGTGVGASVAHGTVTTHTLAELQDSVAIRRASSGAPDVAVQARNNLPGSGKSVITTAIAGTGGFMLGLNATESTAQNAAEAKATVGIEVSFGAPGLSPVAIGNIDITATNSTNQYATTTGIAAGLLALGFNYATAKTTDTVTLATIGNSASVNAASLDVVAVGTDTNYASATAGTGGVIAGNAASSTTSSTSHTTASVGLSITGYSVTGLFQVLAQHNANFDGRTDSVNASIVGGSGAYLNHSVDSTVTATIIDNVKVRASDFVVRATNTVTHTFSDEADPGNAAWGLKAGSGGLLNGPAGRVDIDVTQNTTVTIGNTQDIHILAKGSGLSTFLVEAENRTTVHDKSRLDAGGLISAADMQATLDVTANATISLGGLNNGGSSFIVDVGNVNIGAWNTASLDLRAVSEVYGLAGVPFGKSHINYTGTNTTNVRQNTRLEASSGEVVVAAGASPDGQTRSKISANATVDLWNKVLTPIVIPPDAEINVSSNANVTIDGSGNAANAGIRSAGDMSIIADRGDIIMTAVGTGKDIYRESIGAALRAIFGGDISFDYKSGSAHQSGTATATIDGVLLTGVQRSQFLTINYDYVGNNPLAVEGLLVASSGLTFQVLHGVSISTNILIRLAQLQNLAQQYAADPIALGAYNSEMVFLRQKLIALGLATGDPFGQTPGNPFVMGQWAQSVQAAYASLQKTIQLIGSGLTGAPARHAAVDGDLQGIYNASGGVRNSGQNIADTVGEAWDTIMSNTSEILNYMTGLSKYSTVTALLNTVNSDVLNVRSMAAEIRVQIGRIDGERSVIISAKSDIANAIGVLGAQKLIIDNPGSSQAQLDAAYATARNAAFSLNQALTSAKFAADTIQNANAILVASANTLVCNPNPCSGGPGANSELTRLRNDLQAAVNAAVDTGNNNDKSIRDNNIGPKFVKMNENIGYVFTERNNANEQMLNTTNAVAAFGNPFTNTKPDANGVFADGHGHALRYYSDLVYNNANTYVSDRAALSAAGVNAQGLAVNVGSAEAKLGDLSIRANVLKGSGALGAPGDASITITNNTASTLRVNDLTINSESGGHIRFNGVLVDSLAEIKALRGGSDANFSQVATAKAQYSAGTIPTITITSTYDPASAPPGFVPAAVAAAVGASGNLPAPDIVLVQGTKIDNPLGLVKITSQAGNIYANGEISAAQVTILVKNGDFIQSYVAGFNHIAGDPAGVAFTGGDPTLDATGGGIVANGSIFISARYLNINGLIQSGIDEWKLDLPASYGLQLGAQQANGLYPIILPSGSNLAAYYDASNNRIQVDATKVLGGYVQLFGQIMNTSPNVGQIRALDGFGRITINSQLPYDLYVNVLDAGQDPNGNGRGIQGRIDITNILGINNVTKEISALRTVYTRNSATDQINVVNTTGVLDAIGQVVGSSQSFQVGGRATSYDLQNISPGLRYVYTTGKDTSTISYLTYTGTQLLGTSTLTVASNTVFDSVDGPHTLATYRIASGTYVKVDTANDAVKLVSDTTTRTTADPVYVKTAEWTSCNWWSLCISQTHHMELTKTEYNTEITTNSLKANYPIGITFGGRDDGIISVTSAQRVLLNGAINNRSGDTTITAKAIVQNNDAAKISSKNITLTSTAGSIGTLNGPAVKVDITNGGVLAAAATAGNVVVEAAHGLRFSTVTATGNPSLQQGRVVLSASENIERADANAYIEAPRIELSSANGSIGSAAAPILIHLGYVDTTNGFVGYYGFKAQAATDINVTSVAWAAGGNAQGHLLLDTVASTGGNVTLTAPGRIIDNNPIQSINTLTYNQLLSYWDSLGLLENTQSNADKKAATIATFEAGRTADYRTYWQIRQKQTNGGTTYDASFQYVASTAERTLLTQQFTSQGVPAGQINARIADYETSRTAQYRALHTEVGGYTTTFNANLHYSSTTAEQNSLLNGSSWTEQQLALSLSPGALKTITGTNPIDKLANVSGQTVTLNAGQGLGQSLATITIDSSTVTSSQDLTDAQKIALATAERRDFLTSANPNLVVIVPRQPLNFGAGAALNVNVTAAPSAGTDSGMVYLASMGDGLLGNINVSGDASIKVRGSIVNATPSSPTLLANNIILEAANGAIGLLPDVNGNYVSTPLRVQVGSGKSLVARAQAGIDIVSGADLPLDTVYSPNDVKLTVTAGSLLNANNDLLINVLGSTVTLNLPAGGIGQVGHALNVGNHIGGGVVANTFGLINLFGPMGYRLILKNVVSAADITVAALDAGVDGTVTSANRIEFNVSREMAVSATSQITSLTDTVAFNTAFGTLPATSRIAMAAGAQVTGATGVVVWTGADATVANLSATTGNIVGRAGGAFNLAAGAQLNTPAGLIDVIADSIAMGQGSKMTSATTIGLQATRDVTLGALVSTASPAANSAPVITVSAGDANADIRGSIISNGDGQTNFTVTRPNASILLTAVGGIGVDSSLNPPATPTVPPGYITVETPILTATALTGDINIRATGNLKASLSTPVGKTDVTTTGTFIVDNASGIDVDLNSPGDLIVGTITAEKSVTLSGKVITGNIVHTGTGELEIDVTGPNGGMAQNVTLNINAPSTEVGNFFATDAKVTTTGSHFGIDNGFVSGKLVLTVAGQNIVLDNRSPVPNSGANVQMYGPGQNFYLDQNGRSTYTSIFIVSYDEQAAPTALSLYPGGSFIRDFPRDSYLGEVFDVQGAGKGSTFYIIGVSPAFMLDAAVLPKAVDKTGEGPAVNF